MRNVALSLFAVLFVTMLGCGGADPEGMDLTGSWAGSWQNASPSYNGSFNASVLQSGSTLTGSGTMSGLPGFDAQSGQVSAAVAGDVVSGTVSNSIGQLQFQLTVASDGQSLSGTYTFLTFSGKLTLTRAR